MNPVKTLSRAVTLPFTAVFVVAICGFINWSTTPGHWWVQWVILGMGIAVVSAWARAIRLLVAAGALAAVGTLAYRIWGERGREQLRRWRETTR